MCCLASHINTNRPRKIGVIEPFPWNSGGLKNEANQTLRQKTRNFDRAITQPLHTVSLHSLCKIRSRALEPARSEWMGRKISTLWETNKTKGET